ncbi:TetR/AcrR family transcriptional regulator [Nocardia sp. FBN12]|uniref:TetR/AcrR family transcriptional regulator n=1 Tax=Nocardia sp. FBN12 TaxID=3419766 RepID=UPI003D03A9E0
MTRRTPTGAAVLQPAITKSITDAVLVELAEHGYARLSMEAVAKRAGVGKSALYRRWPSKQDMAIAVVSELSVGLAPAPDTGSLRGDVRGILASMLEWLSHPLFFRILPDLVAEMARNPELAAAIEAMIGIPRRARGAEILQRAVARGELSPGLDLEIALDVLAGPLYWRLSVRRGRLEPGYLDSLTEVLLRALGAATDNGAHPQP